MTHLKRLFSEHTAFQTSQQLVHGKLLLLLLTTTLLHHLNCLVHGLLLVDQSHGIAFLNALNTVEQLNMDKRSVHSTRF